MVKDFKKPAEKCQDFHSFWLDDAENYASKHSIATQNILHNISFFHLLKMTVTMSMYTIWWQN